MKRNRLGAAVRATRQSKRQARELLDAGHNRLWLSLSICLWIVTAGAVYLLGAGLVYAADDSIFTDQPSLPAVGITLISYALMLLLAFFLLVPMAGGVMLLARYVYQGRLLEAADLLAAFDSPKQYFGCMKLGMYGLAHPLMTVAVALLGCIAAPAAMSEWMHDIGATSVLSWFSCAGVLVIGAALTFIMVVVCRTAPLKGALMARGMTWRAARAYTKDLLAKSPQGSLYYNLSFSGHVALAVVTVGVSAVIDGIGYALLSHQFSCEPLKTQEKLNEEIDK